MAKIKKAQGGGLIRKGIKALGTISEKANTPMGKTLSKKVKEAKFQKHMNKFGMTEDDISFKEFKKMGKDAVKGTTDINKTPNSPRPMLTDAQKANNARILQEIREGKRKNGGKVGKMKNGGSLSALNASNKRMGPIDPKGAYTTVQKKALAGAKGKASLTKDKQLGATKMAKRGMSIKKK